MVCEQLSISFQTFAFEVRHATCLCFLTFVPIAKNAQSQRTKTCPKYGKVIHEAAHFNPTLVGLFRCGDHSATWHRYGECFISTARVQSVLLRSLMYTRGALCVLCRVQLRPDAGAPIELVVKQS